MLQVERHEKIIEIVNQSGFISVEALMDALSISRSTARRDLQYLEEMQMLIRARGGAVSVKSGTSHEPPIKFRRDLQLEEKQRIAVAALDFIHERATVLIDSGTTTIELAKLLSRFNSIMVATYDLYIANELSTMPNISLVVAGGVLRKDFNTLIGYFTEEIINQIHADIYFMSVDAIDLDHGCMNFNIEEISVKKALIKAAKKVIVLSDHTKFETVAFMNTCQLSDVDTIITGSQVRPDVVSRLLEKGIEVILV